MIRIFKFVIFFGPIKSRRDDEGANGDCEKYIYYILVGRYERKRPLGTHRRRWEDNIKMDFKGIGFRVTHDWVQWWALVNTAMKLRFP
jgi:hypothetical protein